jgi:hypothetical protein
MTRSFLLASLSCIIVNTATSKIWTVDNTGKVANYSNILLAIATAGNGDTLLVGGGGASYGGFTLSKNLCIVGTGYFLTENPNTVENKGPVLLGAVTLSTGSDGSMLVGLQLSASLVISSSNTVVKRCYMTNNGLTITGNNNLVKQCYLSPTANNSIAGTNNVVRNSYIAYETYTGALYFTCGPNNIIENNVFNMSISITSSSFGNNIMPNGTATFTSCNPYNNIGNALQFGTSNGNQSYVNMTSVFVSSGTTDGKWQLASSSPAKSAGLGGVDCGMFGGNDPYVLSGLPEVPVITSIVVPSRASLTNGLNIQLNVQSKK